MVSVDGGIIAIGESRVDFEAEPLSLPVFPFWSRKILLQRSQTTFSIASRRIQLID